MASVTVSCCFTTGLQFQSGLSGRLDLSVPRPIFISMHLGRSSWLRENGNLWANSSTLRPTHHAEAERFLGNAEHGIHSAMLQGHLAHNHWRLCLRNRLWSGHYLVR